MQSNEKLRFRLRVSIVVTTTYRLLLADSTENSEIYRGA